MRADSSKKLNILRKRVCVGLKERASDVWFSPVFGVAIRSISKRPPGTARFLVLEFETGKSGHSCQSRKAEYRRRSYVGRIFDQTGRRIDGIESRRCRILLCSKKVSEGRHLCAIFR